ncbi:uncharacterized protein F58A4.6 [Thrips palmi]|uniref:Uncharacterized protein F58A4.6 n=1 Tax=Thrips palmi TaxID=161013 RepID=A0A6P8YFZ6_THRPL|nr:uncharacterized protein F58A4.6 [Thrips palmi]
MAHMKIVVYSNNCLWEQLIVGYDTIVNKVTEMKRREDFGDGDNDIGGFEIVSHRDLVIQSDGDQVAKKHRTKFSLSLNSLIFSYFVKVLQCSGQFRICVLDYWLNKMKYHIPNCKNLTLKVTLVEPPNQVLDYNWCHRINYMVMERSELDNAMSWLSTLGGAYSALGDHFSHCAEMAGRISIRQFQLALRLGDPSTVARCKLYIALSLIQNYRFKPAQHIIETQYHLAMDSASPDTRLIRMCRGIWSKLRYERSQYLKRTKV